MGMGINENLAIDIPQGGSSCPQFPGQIGIWNVGFGGGRKTGGAREKPLQQRQEPKTNSIHMWYQVWESNQGHGGGRQVLSLLCHSCFANWLVCNAEYAILFSTLTQKLRLLNPISKSKLFHLHQWTPDTYDKINKCIIQTTSLLAYDTWEYFSFNLD